MNCDFERKLKKLDDRESGHVAMMMRLDIEQDKRIYNFINDVLKMRDDSLRNLIERKLQNETESNRE